MISFPTDDGLKQDLRQWVMARIEGYYAGPGSYPIAILREGKLAAVVIYDNYKGTDVTITVAAEGRGWLQRVDAAQALSFPFIHLGVNRITALIKKKNKRSRKLTLGFGFKEEGVLRCAAEDGTDMVLYGLTKADLNKTISRLNNGISR